MGNRAQRRCRRATRPPARRSSQVKATARAAIASSGRDPVSVQISPTSDPFARPEQLETSLLDPNAEILPENRFYRVVTRDGTAVTGRLLNLDTFQVMMLDPKEQLRTFAKSDLREHGFADGSTMPSYRSTLSRQELADVIAYLLTLKGITAQ